MPFSYKIEEGIVFTTATGETTAQEQAVFKRTWLADPDLPTPLLICREVVDVGRTPNWSREQARVATSMDYPEGTRPAIVVGKDLHYGMARQYKSWADDPSFEVGIFRDRDEAIKWLRQESD